jgi:hypothetical protein
MTEPNGIAPFKAYIESVKSVKPKVLLARPEKKVLDEAALADMQTHILSFYDKVEVLHSFADETGAVYDCIPLEKQPSLKGVSGRVPAPPDAPKIDLTHTMKEKFEDSLIPLLSPDRKDKFGNAMHCPPGTIPLRRITIEDLSRFRTIDDFLRKAPRGSIRPPNAAEPPTVPVTHRWAHAYQNVANGGAHCYLNIWDPSIGANQIFSLSQMWIVGGSGAKLQTLEAGWQVYPALYNDTKPHLFTYWTADDYYKTGCYNLTCKAFVQTSSVMAPGMAVGPISSVGGPQYIMRLAWWHTGGRWWLYYNGTAGTNVIGYYPDSLYAGGALAGNAAEIDFGGETVGTSSFPPMGSGKFANQGWQKAAYQRTIGYWAPAGGTMIDANLTPSQGWPNCYTAQVVKYGSPWLETLWFGGPGGNC